MLVAWLSGAAARWSAAGTITMKANMALAQLLAGLALLVLEAAQTRRAARAVGAGIGALVLLVGALTLGEHIFQHDLGIDQLLAAEPPGAAATTSPNRMGPPGSTSLVLVGAGLLGLAWGRRRIVPYLGLAVCLVNLLPAVGFLFGIGAFYGKPHLTAIAWPAVVGLLALGLGLVVAHPETGPIALLRRDDAGGALLRRFLPAVLLIPLVLGLLREMGERRGLFHPGVGTGTLVLTLILIFSTFLWLGAARLSRSDAELRALALFPDQNPFPVLRVAREGTILYANQGSARLLRHWGCQVGDAAPEFLRSILERALAGQPVSEVLTDCEGQVFSFNVAPIGDAGYANLYGRDVTERVRLDKEREQHRAALAEANEAKDLFLNILSHELRTPLTAMSNSVELLRRAEVSTESRTRALGILERNIGHQAGLIDDLLDLSRITRGKVKIEEEPLDLRKLVAAQLEAVEAEANKAGVGLRLTPGSAPVPVSGDRMRLGQVMSNLLLNAIKFTEPRGSITVTVSGEDGQATVRVRDTGVGISAEHLPHIFEAFRQAERTLTRTRGGLGIGLAVARSFAELHGGALEAHSDGPGLGSEFVLRLPLREQVALPQGEVRAESTGSANGQRVLVVEDNPDLRDSLQMLLEVMGYVVIVAADGRTGVELARTGQPDVVLIDIGLPDIDGYQVARDLRADPATEKLRLIAVTGYATSEHKDRALQAGFDRHLGKPVDPEQLARVLGGGAAVEAPNRRQRG